MIAANLTGDTGADGVVGEKIMFARLFKDVLQSEQLLKELPQLRSKNRNNVGSKKRNKNFT